MTGGGRDPATTGGQAVKFWLEISGGFESNATFDGEGTALPVELTIVTDSSPARTRQRTALVLVVQQ